MLWSINSCQDTISNDQCHLTVSRAQVQGQWSYWRPHAMINLIPFFLPNVGSENGSTRLKNLFLNNTGKKEEKNHWQVTQLKCRKLMIYVLPPYKRRKTSKSAALWKMFSRTCSCSIHLCWIVTLELLTKVNFQDPGSQPSITCYFERGILMTVNHTVNHSIAKYSYVKGHFWVFRWRYTFARTV